MLAPRCEGGVCLTPCRLRPLQLLRPGLLFGPGSPGNTRHLTHQNSCVPVAAPSTFCTHGACPGVRSLALFSSAPTCGCAAAVVQHYRCTAKSITGEPPAWTHMLVVQEVATFTASCEKYVGTESGGMDQAISIMGAPGIAKLVEFNPVPPPLPNSGTKG